MTSDGLGQRAEDTGQKSATAECRSRNQEVKVTKEKPVEINHELDGIEVIESTTHDL